MIALIMAGGLGSRMKSDTEKLLLEYDGKPIVRHVFDALDESGCFEDIRAATSPNAPGTKQLFCDLKVSVIETDGASYVQDLSSVLKELSDYVLVVPGDMPFLDEQIIRIIISKHVPQNAWTSFVVSTDFLDANGLAGEFRVESDKQYAYTGISLVDARVIDSLNPVIEHHIVINDKRVAFNMNTKSEYDLLGVA